MVSQEQEENSQVIAWEEQSGASGYLVEILQDDKKIYTLETQNNEVSLLLFPGEYLYQVSVLNKFGNISSQSDWKNLTVQLAMTPVILRLEKDTFYLEQGRLTFNLEAQKIQETSIFRLIQQDRSIQVDWSKSDDDWYEVSVNFEGLDLGWWDLEVEDPSGRKDLLHQALEIIPKLEPVISEDLRIELQEDDVLPQIEIIGSGFEDNCIVRFEGPRTIRVMKVQYISPEKINLLLDISTAIPGIYNVSMENPSGNITEHADFLEILEVEIIQETMTIPGAGKQERLIDLQMGYSYSKPLGEMGDIVEESAFGYYFTMGVSLNNRINQSIPLLKDLSFTVSVDNQAYKTKDYPAIFNLFAVDSQIRYISSFNIPLQIYLSAGGGPVLGSTTEVDNLNTDITLDFQLSMDGGFQYYFMDYFYGVLGLSYVKHFAVNRTTDFIKYEIGIGLWTK
ncbi:MAG: hypothetical protein PF447_09680 [Spirochaetaceae bacterium]|nr:hypothetical protein [Spirochaetaceae bacterium]